ncbi:MAG: alkaline phosphatase D family protein [Pseudomonadota bacterium]
MQSAPRRRFIRQLCSSSALAATGIGIAACRTASTLDGLPLHFSFAHGVASGDPLADRVILWTRATPRDPDEERDIAIEWQVALDPHMQRVVSGGSTLAGPQQDYTVKVDATGLRPGQVYYYRFSSGGTQSPVGRTKTLPPADVKQVRLAVFCCSNYPAGYFNVYADAARQDHLDCALHIGDYIYEYEKDGYACGKAKALGRISDPPNLLLVLSDYRRRYAQYRGDADLQALHAAMPFITVWDDHEFADDAWRDGAADHTPSEQGPFALRKAAAIRAYHEWMPIRAPDPAHPEIIYRSFDFGKLVSLHMLDTRITGRDQQVEMSSYMTADQQFDAQRFRADVSSPRRQMMGAQQMAWLEQSVARSRAAWQIVGQQVLMARMEYPLPVAQGQMSCADFVALKEKACADPSCIDAQQAALLAAPTLPCYLDSWDGYQSERERLFDIMRRHDKNLVVLAGDTHNAWASDLHDRERRQVGVEFAAPSVSSPGLECAHPQEDPEQVARMMEQLIAPLYYAQTSQRGYMLITATAAEVRCDWRFVDTVESRHYQAHTGRSLCTVAGRGRRCIEEIA